MVAQQRPKAVDEDHGAEAGRCTGALAGGQWRAIGDHQQDQCLVTGHHALHLDQFNPPVFRATGVGSVGGNRGNR